MTVTLKSVALSLVFFATLMLSSCHKASGGGDAAFSYTLDSALQPQPATLGDRPLARLSDAEGLETLFIENTIIVRPENRAEVDALIADLNAKGLEARLAGDDAAPLPPPDSQLDFDATFATPVTYLIEINPSKAHAYLDSFAADAVAAGFEGSLVVSSEDAAALLAVAMRVAASGLKAGPDFVSTPDGFTSTEEAEDGSGGFRDAFAMTPFLTTGARSNVVQAWQLVDAAGGAFTRMHVAIIDGGFWLDATGRPGTASTGDWNSDLPALPTQYNFGNGSYVADGTNPSHCTGGSDCPWHGNGSASVATGLLNNRYGAAGTGGQVADPWLFKVDLSDSQVRRALRTALAWGGDVASMSFGGSCGWACRRWRDTLTYYTDDFAVARDFGLVMVAAAGNDNADVNSKHDYPCVLPGVICVGALANASSDRISYSNRGDSVDIWAPTNIPSMPDMATSPANGLHRGTSASTPFVAGVAAMIKAFDPSLGSDAMKAILRDRGHGSTDPDVDRTVNAYLSLRATAPEVDIPPTLSLSLAVGDASRIVLGRPFEVHAAPSDVEDGTPCCDVTWDVTPTSTTSRGRTAVFILRNAGPQTLTATATDFGGKRVQATLDVVVINASPSAMIGRPSAGQHVLAGVAVQLLGSATDANEGPGPEPGLLSCSSLLWTSTDAGDVGLPANGCDLTVTFVTPGPRSLSLEATDPQGGWGAVYVDFVVDPAPTNYPPSILLGAVPAVTYNGDGYVTTDALVFPSSATDPEGDAPITYTWRATSYQPGSTTAAFASDVIVGAATTASGDLSWTPTSTPALFISNCTVANAYAGQRVELSVEAKDALGNTSTLTLPPFQVYFCTLG